MLGSNGLQLQRATQRDVRRMLWGGLKAVQDLTSSESDDSCDEDEQASSSFAVQSAGGRADADEAGAPAEEMMNEEDEVLPLWGELRGDNFPELPEGEEEVISLTVSQECPR